MDNLKMICHDTKPDEEPDQFYFESDHLALKGNKDYTALLKAIVTLEAQRTQAIEDLDKLMENREKALQDPISFVAQLQNGELPELPGPQKIADIPSIDWSKYNIGALDNNKLKPQTRHGQTSNVPQVKQEQDDGKILVRGRAFDESKPETFNQLWTTEEQRRLEQLLIEYPPEEIEMRRWTKIANALGNRTPKQVSSRVQKYFIKLLRAGMPIPGRGPKFKVDVARRAGYHRLRNNLMYRRSTFFPHQDVPMLVEEEPKERFSVDESEDDTSGIPEDPELRQIELLRQVKLEKEADSSNNFEHIGFKCNVCNEEPLKGTRWHCTECKDVDLCADCAVAQLESENPTHPPSHKLNPIRSQQYSRSYDLDYSSHNFSDSSYNYLDPNFLPE